MCQPAWYRHFPLHPLRRRDQPRRTDCQQGCNTRTHPAGTHSHGILCCRVLLLPPHIPCRVQIGNPGISCLYQCLCRRSLDIPPLIVYSCGGGLAPVFCGGLSFFVLLLLSADAPQHPVGEVPVAHLDELPAEFHHVHETIWNADMEVINIPLWPLLPDERLRFRCPLNAVVFGSLAHTVEGLRVAGEMLLMASMRSFCVIRDTPPSG